ncbi:unnamed protein product, partial [Arabidopsis halleri]
FQTFLLFPFCLLSSSFVSVLLSLSIFVRLSFYLLSRYLTILPPKT